MAAESSFNSPITVIPDDRDYLQKKPSFSGQYDSVYSQRNAIFLPLLKQISQSKWPGVRFVERIIDVHNFETDQDLIISGLVIKDSKKRPNIIKLFQRDRTLTKVYRATDNFVDEKDTLFIEDAFSKVQLTGNITHQHFVTGTPIAAIGRLTEGGLFDISEFTYSMPPPQKHRLNQKAGPFHLAFLSDMRIGSPESDSLCLDLVSDHIASLIEPIPTTDSSSSSSSSSPSPSQTPLHLIIAGSSLVPTAPVKRQFEEFSAFEPENIVAPVAELDALLVRLCGMCSVSLLPGAEDPTNYLLPQQPLHHLLLPRASAMTSFIPATNPHKETVNGMLFAVIVGTSGQNLIDLQRFTTFDALSAAEFFLKCSHICPTAPDSTGVFPVSATDPFVLDEMPSIFFIGGAAKMEHKIIDGPVGQRCLILLVPSFSSTGDLVIVDPLTLTPRIVHFATDLSPASVATLAEKGKEERKKEDIKATAFDDKDILIDELGEDDMD